MGCTNSKKNTEYGTDPDEAIKNEKAQIVELMNKIKENTRKIENLLIDNEKMDRYTRI